MHSHAGTRRHYEGGSPTAVLQHQTSLIGAVIGGRPFLDDADADEVGKLFRGSMSPEAWLQKSHSIDGAESLELFNSPTYGKCTSSMVVCPDNADIPNHSSAATLKSSMSSSSDHLSQVHRKVIQDAQLQESKESYEKSLKARSLAKRLVEHQIFGMVIAILIFLNGVLIGVEADYDFSTMGPGWKAFGVAADFFFTSAFTCELLLKMGVYKLRFWSGPDRTWNAFDLILVVMSFTETFVLPFAGGASDLSSLSVLRLLRLLRVIRLLRLLRAFRQLWLFVCGLCDALSVVFWCMTLVVLVVYMAAIFCCNQLKSLGDDDEIMYEHWHSVTASMLTLFQLTTGDSWASGIVRPVTRIYPYMWAFFLVFVCITQFAFVNVVIAIICENVLKCAETTDESLLRQAEAELKTVLQNIYHAFTIMDEDQNGLLERAEFVKGLKSPHTKACLSKVDISLEDAAELFDIIDADKSGSLTLEEFVHGCMKGRGVAKAKDTLALTCAVGRVEQRLASLDKVIGIDGEVPSRLDKIEAKISSSKCTTTKEEFDTQARVLSERSRDGLPTIVDPFEIVRSDLQKAEAQWPHVGDAIRNVAKSGNVDDAVKAAKEMASHLLQISATLQILTHERPSDASNMEPKNLVSV